LTKDATTADRWQQVAEVYLAAGERDPADRDAFLREACEGDEGLRREVESLLGYEGATDPWIEQPAAALAAPMLDNSASPSWLTGRQIGPYTIVSLLDSGGMGEVYRAHDTTLGRDVAIKILPPEFTAHADRRARFAREARLLAALNHPHIGAIYGLEEAEGVTALVLELVDGPTLADRIAQGQIPVNEALSIAKQIAEALEAAHEQGIIHRDLKPANVKVREDGTVKVLDFGLAKALEPVSAGSTDATASPKVNSPAMMTRIGVILGTAAYMSPEQAKGHAADKRSDVWAFGCVLFEMVAGRRAFEGEGISDTLAAVLRGEPEWTALPANVSPALVALLRGCLDKDRRRRVADLSTARFIIDREGDAVTAVAVPPSSTIRRAASILVAVATVGIAAYTTFSLARVSAPSLPVVRSTIALPMGDRFPDYGLHVVALSADGTHLAYAANQRLYLRPLNQLDPTPISGTEVVLNQARARTARTPFFSPEGRWIGFWQDGQLKKVSITGGAPLMLCPADDPWGVSWTSDNTILYGQSEEGAGTGAAGIWRVSSEGGKPDHVVKVKAGQIAHSPQLLPGGRAILFTLLARRYAWDTAQIVVQSLDSGKRNVVVERGAGARYVPTGHLVYALDGTLLAVPFDVTRLAPTGDAVPLVGDVAQPDVTAQFAISSQGGLVYVPRGAIAGPYRPSTMVWVDRQDREVPIKKVPSGIYVYPRLSHDGTRVALEVREPGGTDIWIWHLPRETLERLTLEPTFEGAGVWVPPDGKTVIYASSKIGGFLSPRSLFRRPADGTGTPKQLIEGTVAQSPSTVTPDGTALIVLVQTPPSKAGSRPGTDVYLLPLAGEHRPRPLLTEPFDELNAEVSPNGQWLAYESNESGPNEIYVRPFPNVDAGRWQVSTNGGRQPLWARSGQELFYESMGTLMRVPVKTGSAFERGTPEKVVDASPYLVRPRWGSGRMYDVSADGKRFLMIKETSGADEPPPSARIILVQNWFEELKRLVPRK
jgi:eukaryotic-like serine/threonine-protein kinase